MFKWKCARLNDGIGTLILSWIIPPAFGTTKNNCVVNNDQLENISKILYYPKLWPNKLLD
jgi:hypothetical protein